MTSAFAPAGTANTYRIAVIPEDGIGKEVVPVLFRQSAIVIPDIDFWIVRENTEGEYSQIGGRLHAGTADEIVVQEAIFTRRGTDRIIRYAFELARRLGRKHATSAIETVLQSPDPPLTPGPGGKASTADLSSVVQQAL